MARNAGGGETEGLENSSFSMQTKENSITIYKLTKEDVNAKMKLPNQIIYYQFLNINIVNHTTDELYLLKGVKIIMNQL